MAVVWAHCKTKMVYEPDEPKEEGEGAENDEPEVMSNHRSGRRD
jgi:DNA-directed RNA polymerase II subunit RPB1